MKLAAAYVRVSTEEQALHGYSIQAQREAIQAYAEANGCQIVAEYADEGVSGKKPYNKRPALSRFMSDIQNGKKVDVLLFTKLDRLFRSVKHYYKAAEILDACGVSWVAIHEDYETETANGRLKVNLMLSIAEHEADRTGERIRAVNVSKVAHNRAIGHVPLGFKIENHRVVHNPEMIEAARAFFYEYERNHSIVAAVRYLEERFGVKKSLGWARIELKNTIYKGEYRGNPKYCEPLIPPEDFDRIQRLLKKRSVRRNQTKRIYLFSGLCVCADCGLKMTGTSNQSGGYYRCNHHRVHPTRCANGTHVREDVIETWLLLHVRSELENARLRVAAEYEHIKQTAPDKAAVKVKLNRLVDLYLDSKIDRERYDADYERLQAQLAEIARSEQEQTKTPDFDGIREKLMTLNEVYQSMTPQEKQTFWREIIEKLVIDVDGNVQVYFLTSL